MDTFTPTLHTSIYTQIDPTKTTFPIPFTVCVIGASTGIGEHVAYAYAKAGARSIIVASRRLEHLELVASKCRSLAPESTVEAIQCDVTSSDSVKALAERVQNEYGRLDVVISNPGYAGPVILKVTDGNPVDFQHCFDVNVVGTYHAAHYLIPLLLSSQGGAKAFFTIGSLAACILNGPIANTGYCLSKMAQSRFIEFLAEQYGPEGLLSVNVHPGAVMTEMAEGNTPDEFLPYLTDAVDLCGGFVVWLAKKTDEMEWLNGRTVSATWDVDELLERKGSILSGNLLRWTMSTS